MKNQNLYCLRYYSGNRLIETIMVSKPIALCKWKMNQLKSTTHRTGVLRIENE